MHLRVDMFASSGRSLNWNYHFLSEGQWTVHLSLLPGKSESTIRTSILAFLSYKKIFFHVATHRVARLSDTEIKKIQNLSLTAAIWHRATPLQLIVLDTHIMVFVLSGCHSISRI